MFTKTAKYKLIDLEPLNTPTLPEYMVNQHIKIAQNAISLAQEQISAANKNADFSRDGDNTSFDLEAEINKHPNSLFIKCFAIKADEENDNGDYFSRDELIKATPTFVGVPIFTNHKNDDVNEARGRIIHSWWDNDRNGIMVIARVDAEAYPQLARGIKEDYIVGCFPPDAPVLMSDGTEKPICDIEDGDYVISGKGIVRKVLGKRQRRYKHPLLSVKTEGSAQDLVLTSYHKILVYRMPEFCACGCQEMLIAQKDTRLTSKNFSRVFKQGHNFRCKHHLHEYIQKIAAHELRPGDFLVEPKLDTGNSLDLIKNEKEAFLVGLFLAEGSFEKRNGERHSIIFNFSHTELETLADKCHDLLFDVFGQYKNKPTINWYPESSQTRVCLHGREIADWFYHRCGEYSDEKKLHPDILNSSPEILSSILAGFIEGNGWNVKSKSYGLVTVSPKLASQLRLMLNSLGVRARYRQRKSTGYGYKLVHEITFGLTTAKQIYDRLVFKKADNAKFGAAKWYSTDRYSLRRVRSINEIDYNGTVYDIEVEEDHSYCVNHLAVGNTSMGCQVAYSCCSICHNRAETPDQYCEHIRERKTRILSAKKVKCQFHKNGPKDEPCPICGSTKDDPKTFDVIEKKAFEYNFGIRFIENSFVVNPACHECGVTEVIDPAKFRKKVAEIAELLPRLLKSANADKVLCDDKRCYHIAGQKQLQDLHQALDLLVSVSQDMLRQKDQIDLEFMSDLVKVLADLQGVTDELTQQGYGRLPEPGQTAPAEGTAAAAPPAVAAPINPTPGGGSKIEGGPAGPGATVTAPTAESTINLEKFANILPQKLKININTPIFTQIDLPLENEVIRSKKRLL